MLKSIGKWGCGKSDGRGREKEANRPGMSIFCSFLIDYLSLKLFRIVPSLIVTLNNSVLMFIFLSQRGEGKAIVY
jgi:hypothetical protein